MVFRDARLAELVSRLADESPEQRRAAAGEVSERRQDLAAKQADELAKSLVLAVLRESDSATLATQLAALTALTQAQPVSRSVVAHVRDLDHAVVLEADRGMLGDLIAYAEAPY